MNAQIQEGLGTVASEWQNFVSGRLKEDIAFVTGVPCAGSGVGDSYGILQRAMDDSGSEYLLIGKLAGSMTSKAAATVNA